MLGSFSTTVTFSRKIISKIHSDISDLHLSMLGPKSWTRISEKASLHADFDMISLPTIFINSSEAFSSESERGLHVRLGVPQATVEWKLEWHIAIVHLIENAFKLKLKGSGLPPPPKPAAPPTSASTEQKANAPGSNQTIRVLDIDFEHVNVVLTMSPTSTLTGEGKIINSVIEFGGKKGTIFRATARALAVQFNEFMMLSVSETELTNSVKISDVQKHLSSFTESSKYAYATIEGGSKTYLFVVKSVLYYVCVTSCAS